MTKMQLFMTVDKWYCHKLRLPGWKHVCNAFDSWVMGDEEDWGGPEAEG